ncbi:hypothetical protein DH2020_029088 [Rehmannia glutinosa]|uniref:Endonuclease V n=1 Tax=Rehmannia glutinosa TaxID=99300 RepID=A0ABR0VRA7_REHGL
MSMEQDPSTSENYKDPQLLNKWIQIQDSLKKRLTTEDGFNWKLPQDSYSGEILKYVGGVDLSFSKNDPSIACATLVVLDFSTLEVVHEDSAIVKLSVPYVPGFLAFREAPVLLELLEKMKKRELSSYPQVLMVDGFGLACHLGVLADLPTIGIEKNLHHVDGLTQPRARQLLEANVNSGGDIITLIGDSGSTFGVAMRSMEDSMKPIFISVGHRISLASAIKIVKLCCKFRVPEPTRQADIRSKDYLRKFDIS